MKQPIEQIYDRMQRIYSEEIFKDFQEALESAFIYPSAIWAYDIEGKLISLTPRQEFTNFPGFCSHIRKRLGKPAGPCFCNQNDAKQLMDFLENYVQGNGNKNKPWEMLKCRMGLSRLIFPIVVYGDVVGVLVVGKFKTDKDAIAIHAKVDELCGSMLRDQVPEEMLDPANLENAKRQLNDLMITIPFFDNDKVDEITLDVVRLLKFLEVHYSRSLDISNKPTNSILGGMHFLERIDYAIADTSISAETLWKRVSEIFAMIVDNLNLETAVGFFTDRDDYQRLMAISSYSRGATPEKELSMATAGNLPFLEERRKGLILPTKADEFTWMNSHIEKVFGTSAAILYANHVFPQRWLVIGFGFKDKVFLSTIERYLLRAAESRIMTFVRNVISGIELEQIMIDSAHKLRRTYGGIKGGLDLLRKYGFHVSGDNEDDTNELIDHGWNSMDSGLMQLDLLTRNYRALGQASILFPAEKTEEDGKAKEFDLGALLREFEQMFAADIRRDKKRIEYEIPPEKFVLRGSRAGMELLLLNLFDNAIKFAYNKTYIVVKLTESKGAYLLEITNRGIGVPEDETEKVFQRHFKSSFRDTSKERRGQGLGLTISRRCINTFFQGGKISLSSRPAPKKFGARNFLGDNYLTIVTVSIPMK